MRRTIGRWVTIVGLSIATSCIAHAQDPSADSIALRIHAPTITAALIQFSQQTGLQLVLPTDNDSANRTAPILEGLYTPSAALEALLRDSGFTFRFVNARTVSISLVKGAHLQTRQRDADFDWSAVGIDAL